MDAALGSDGVGWIRFGCRNLRADVVRDGVSVLGVWEGFPGRSGVLVFFGDDSWIHSWNCARTLASHELKSLLVD